MSLINKKSSKNKKDETIIPLGFCKSDDSHHIFCRIKEFPDIVLTIPNKEDDLHHFSKDKKLAVFNSKFLDKNIKLENIDNVVSSNVGNKNIITFTYKKGNDNYLYWALATKDGEWKVQGSISTIKDRGGVISDYTHKKNHFLYHGESSIHTASTSDLKKWKKNEEPVLKPRPGFFDKDGLKFIASKVTDKGILVFYDASTKENDDIKIQIGLALFSLNDPTKLIWRSDEPIFQDKIPCAKNFNCKGIIFADNEIAIYWYSENTGTLCAKLPIPFSLEEKKNIINKLNKHENNPIISPQIIQEKEWMTEGAFNPTAICIDNKTHLLFRAVGNDGISRIGHSCSDNGINFDKIHPEPVFYLKRTHFGNGPLKDSYDPVMYPSGGSWGGCEDPRLVKVEDTIYLTFNAFDGWDFIRVGYTSIKEEDFKKENWNWTKPELISPVGEINKNWVIFPEKINGKFAILHSLTPELQIDYVDDLKDLSSGKQEIKSKYGRKVPRREWDTWIRGAGPAPIKTDAGWLIFYHAISAEETSKYKLGAMLLDLKDPKKILARSSSPVLLPDMWYENEGKPGIVYACGAVIKDDTLFVYYGGGDKFVCVATTPLKDFINNFKNITERVPFISKVIFS